MTALRQHRAFLVVIALAAVLFLSDIWIYKDFVRAESYFALGSRLMVEQGDWLTPHAPDELPLNKPPLTYWVIGASYKLFGANYGSARLPSVLAALLVLLYTSEAASDWANCLAFNLPLPHRVERLIGDRNNERLLLVLKSESKAVAVVRESEYSSLSRARSGPEDIGASRDVRTWWVECEYDSRSAARTFVAYWTLSVMARVTCQKPAREQGLHN